MTVKQFEVVQQASVQEDQYLTKAALFKPDGSPIQIQDASDAVTSVAGVNPVDGNVPLQTSDIGAVAVAGDTMTGALDMGNNKVTDVADPTANQDAANKSYVDTQIAAVPGALTYQGSWDASTNTPALADGAGTVGDLYKVSVGGSQDLGSGAIVFAEGDHVVYDGATWENFGAGEAVSSVNGHTGVVVLDKSDVGLSNVDNTSDAAKPVSTAAQTAIDAKVSKAGDTMTAALSFGSETVDDPTDCSRHIELWGSNYGISVSDFTLNFISGNDTSGSKFAWYVDSTAVATLHTTTEKPTDLTPKSYVDAADALKAPLASPALTGTPTAPTAAAATSNTQVATTAFVKGQTSAKAAIAALSAVAAADATDGPSAATLANANKAAINDIIAALKA